MGFCLQSAACGWKSWSAFVHCCFNKILPQWFKNVCPQSQSHTFTSKQGSAAAAGWAISDVQIRRGCNTVRCSARRNWNKKSILYRQRLHLVVVSLRVVLIIIKDPFSFSLCLQGLDEGTWSTTQTETGISDTGCSHRWLKGILQVLRFSHLSPIFLPSQLDLTRLTGRPFLEHWFRSSFHKLLVLADCEAGESAGRSTYTPQIRFNRSESCCCCPREKLYPALDIHLQMAAVLSSISVV